MATGKCIALLAVVAVLAEHLDFEDAFQVPNGHLRAKIDFTQQGGGVEQYYARIPMPTDLPQQQRQVQSRQVLQQQGQLPLQTQAHAQVQAQAEVQVQAQMPAVAQAQMQAQIQQQQLQQLQQLQQQQRLQQQSLAQNVKPVPGQLQNVALNLAATKAAPVPSQSPEQGVQGARIAPFGKEDTAAELQNHAAKTQDTLVDAVENAEVAEIKRAVFRALTRLRAASIKEFDTIARLETQAIDEYNDAHHYRAENPLSYIHADEPKVSEDKFTSFH